MAGINYSYLNHDWCLIVSLFPTVPWEELISVPCTHLPALTTLNLCILGFDSCFPQSYWSGLCSETVVNCCVCGSFEVLSHDLEYSPEMWERSERFSGGRQRASLQRGTKGEKARLVLFKYQTSSDVKSRDEHLRYSDTVTRTSVPNIPANLWDTLQLKPQMLLWRWQEMPENHQGW